jgi:CheY-like chemotaxis protein/glycine cleavage system H lipoate-binding protein
MEHKLEILVVDDEQIVLDSINRHLRKENFVLHLVSSAQEGLALLESKSIDIILTDLMMPEIDGLELMKIAKTRQAHIPIIIITGYATIDTALQATQLGAFDYIAKPFTKAELTSVVNRAVNLVKTLKSHTGQNVDSSDIETPPAPKAEAPKHVGKHCWLMLEENGNVIMGVEKSFLDTIANIRNIFLPSKGDELRQGSVYLRLFLDDLQTHTVLSPLSGTVVDINDKLINEPHLLHEDPYKEGWLVRLKPSKFEFEITELGL